MKINRRFTFLYMPEDDAQIRQVRISRVAFIATGASLICLLAVGAFYVIGLWQGSSWVPGGSVLMRENARLATRIGQLEEQISYLRSDLAQVYRLHEVVSVAVDLDPLDPNVWEAGIGGRTPLTLPQEGVPSSQNLDRLTILETELDKLLRQAKIQHQGYRALLDTLAARDQERRHMPSIRPVDTGWLSSGFGKRKDPFTDKLSYHHGLDFSIPIGTPVRTTADGIVRAARNERGFGKVVKIDHGNGIMTIYAHLSQIHVEKGQQVMRGDIIAKSGNSGRVTAPHLHYEVRVRERRVNPLPFILDSYATR
jgi:murein DD-endopeptidase MepM/ murein hydrolase activator NlpD